MNKFAQHSRPDDLQDESAEQVSTMCSINSLGPINSLSSLNAVENLADKNSDNAPSVKTTLSDKESGLNFLSSLKMKHPHKIIIGNLNINSVPNKFEQLKYLIHDKLDILLITETKLDNTFPDSQFIMQGFSKPFRNDRNRKGGGLMIFVREDIPCKKINIDFPSDIECIALEINFRKEKWLFIGCYHPPKQSR